MKNQEYLKLSFEQLNSMTARELTKIRSQIVYDYTHYAVDEEDIETMIEMVNYIDDYCLKIK